jgi:Tfp pilus assembly PilM family ATPase
VIDRLTRRPRPLVCLDFGRDQLTAVEFVDGAVTRWTSRNLAEDVLRNGDPTHPGLLGEAVRQLLARAGIEGRRVRMALPDDATVSRHLGLPAMPRRDLARAMHYAAEKHVPFPIDRARWAWDVVGWSADRVQVYLVATWRDVVDHFVEVARAADLVPELLEPRAVAVARALDQDRALLVDAGAYRLHAMLLIDRQPAFVDQVLTGRDLGDRREALDRLLQRAYRYQSTEAGGGGRLAPVLLAGELELAELSLPVGGRPVSEVLNGQLPAAPAQFRPGAYLANLGLSMRRRR